VASTEASDGQIPFTLSWIPIGQNDFPQTLEARGVVSENTLGGVEAQDGENVYSLISPRPWNDPNTEGSAFVLTFGEVDTRAFPATSVSLDIYLTETEWDLDDFVNIYLIVDGDTTNPVTLWSYGGEVLDDEDNVWISIDKELHYSTSSVQLVVEFSGSIDEEVMYLDDILVGPVDRVSCTPERTQNFDLEPLRVFGYSYETSIPSQSFDLPNAPRQRLVDSTRASDCLIGFDLFIHDAQGQTLEGCSNCRGVVMDPLVDDVNEHSYAMSDSHPGYLELRFDDVATTGLSASKVMLDLLVDGDGFESNEWVNVYAIVDDDEQNVLTILKAMVLG